MPKRPCAPAQAGERYSVCGAKASALNHCAQALGVGSRSRNAATALAAAAGPDVAHVLAASAAFTRSGVSGYWRSRTPVASKNALATAAAVAPITSSPAPV